jgi:hypothetical protein
MPESDARNLREIETLGGEDSTMPGDDAVLAINEDRVIEAELPDARGDHRDLSIIVTLGVPGIRDERRGSDLLNLGLVILCGHKSFELKWFGKVG